MGTYSWQWQWQCAMSCDRIYTNSTLYSLGPLGLMYGTCSWSENSCEKCENRHHFSWRQKRFLPYFSHSQKCLSDFCLRIIGDLLAKQFYLYMPEKIQFSINFQFFFCVPDEKCKCCCITVRWSHACPPTKSAMVILSFSSVSIVDIEIE